jgi:hypothetical protein
VLVVLVVLEALVALAPPARQLAPHWMHAGLALPEGATSCRNVTSAGTSALIWAWSPDASAATAVSANAW